MLKNNFTVSDSLSVETSLDQINAWYLLIRVHDHIIRKRDIPLNERLQSCDLLCALSRRVMQSAQK